MRLTQGGANNGPVSQPNTTPVLRAIRARDPHESGRVATTLELFFDLTFVVAIAAVGVQLHHGLAEGHLGDALGFAMTFTVIWWAWMNYSWYASAYDNDDVVFRLLTFVIMVGVLVMAAGIPDMFDDSQSVIAVAGYVIMRVGMVGLWLRAAKGDPQRRATCLTYATGISVLQVLWIARLWIHDEAWFGPTFVILMGLELLVPVLAERRGRTPFHPHHMAERYALLTIIVLGEQVLSVTGAVQGAIGAGAEGAGWTSDLACLIGGGLLIVFSVWWWYFRWDHGDLMSQPTKQWVLGYGHLLIFGALAAVGSAIAAGVDVTQGQGHGTPRLVSMALAIYLAVFTLTLAVLRHPLEGNWRTFILSVLLSVLYFVAAYFASSVGIAALVIGLLLAAGVAFHVITEQPDRAVDADSPA